MKFNAYHADRYAHPGKIDRVIANPVPDVLLEDSAACLAPTITPFEALARAEINHAIAHAFGSLTPRQQTIVGLHMFGDSTLEDLGDRYGVTRERVRQIECTAMRKIREKLAAWGIAADTIAG